MIRDRPAENELFTVRPNIQPFPGNQDFVYSAFNAFN